MTNNIKSKYWVAACILDILRHEDELNLTFDYFDFTNGYILNILKMYITVLLLIYFIFRGFDVIILILQHKVFS